MGKQPPSTAPTALAASPHISFKVTNSLWWEGEAAASCWEQGNFVSRGFSSFCFSQELLSARSFKKYSHSFRLLEHGFGGEVFCRLSRELEAGMKIPQVPHWLLFLATLPQTPMGTEILVVSSSFHHCWSAQLCCLICAKVPSSSEWVGMAEGEDAV